MRDVWCARDEKFKLLTTLIYYGLFFEGKNSEEKNHDEAVCVIFFVLSLLSLLYIT